MEVNFNDIDNVDNVDEIGIFHNDDGSYSVELYISTAAGERMTIKMPRSSLDLSLINDYDGMSMELKLKGAVSLI